MSSHVDYEGPLLKKGQKRHNWKERWFILKDDMLSYWTKPPPRGEKKGFICLKGCSLDPDYSHNGKPCMLITAADRTLMFKAVDLQTKHCWVSKLQERISELNDAGAREKKPAPLHRTSVEGLPSKPISTGIALYDFEAQQKGELKLSKGDKVSVLLKNDDGWWFGTLEDGRQGVFPGNYLQEGGDAAAVTNEKYKNNPRRKAVFDFAAEDPDQLSFSEGDVIVVIEEHDSGWWGGLLNGRVGMFPENYTEPL